MKTHWLALYFLAALSLTGCGMYAPHAPVTPVLTRGQVEVKLSVAPTASLATTGSQPWVPATEGHIAYSPAPHCLLAVAGGGNFLGPRRPEVKVFYRERQADVAAGYYTVRGARQQWYLAALGGTGVGSVDQSEEYRDDGFFSIYGTVIHYTKRYRGQYRREFAQLYVGFTERVATATFGFRASRLRYTALDKTSSNTTGYYAVASLPTTAVGAWYLEPSYSMRLGKGKWQGVLDGGFSFPLFAPGHTPDNALLRAIPTVFSTVGVVWRPFHPKKSSPD